jgi:GTP-binding protein
VPKGTKLYAISAASGAGTAELLRDTAQLVQAQRNKQAEVEAETDAIPVLRLDETEAPWHITKQIDGKKNVTFIVTGTKIEQFAARTNFDNEEGLQRLRDIMRRLGILHELTRKGIEPGQKIKIGDTEAFPY